MTGFTYKVKQDPHDEGVVLVEYTSDRGVTAALRFPRVLANTDNVVLSAPAILFTGGREELADTARGVRVEAAEFAQLKAEAVAVTAAQSRVVVAEAAEAALLKSEALTLGVKNALRN